MRRWFLPPSVRFLLRGMYFGVLIGIAVGLIAASRYAGASLKELSAVLVLCGLGVVPVGSLLVGWVTKSPREEPDWNAVAARHRRLARVLYIGGCAASLFGFVLLGALGVVAWLRPSFSDHWGFATVLLPAFGGLLVASMGQSILDAAKRAAK